MRIPGRPELGHLTYCTNIHAGEDWPAARASLAAHLPAIKADVSPDVPMGVGLRVSAAMARALSDPAGLDELKALLADDFYAFTINAFPYGAFHAEPVKENVYRPDWGDPARLAYTNACADLLAALLPDGVDGTISTVPCTFKGWDTPVETMVAHLVDHVAHLTSIERRTGKTILLTLEPEPCCYLETIEETVAFFRDHLFADEARGRLQAASRLSAGEAEQALRRHLGVCYDVCHAAVEYEDAKSSFRALEEAGIAVGKLQLSSALRIEEVTPALARQLAPFAEPVYLHQVIERRDGAPLRRHRDLPQALARAEAAAGAEWRVHFHVPLFLKELEHFGTTQPFLEEVLALHAEAPLTQHLEVETYTWDVLPARYRVGGLSQAIARELAWVQDALAR